MSKQAVRSLLLLAVLAFSASNLLARDGLVELLWAERSQDAALASVARVDVDKGVVFSVWHEAAPAGGSVLRAHDNLLGTPLWEVRVPETVTGLSTPRDSVVTTGSLMRGARAVQVTRGLAAVDGRERWRRRDPLGGDDPAPATLLTMGGRLWVVGGSRDRIVVSEMRLGGALRWRDAGPPADDVAAESVDVAVFDSGVMSAGPQALYVAGTRSRGPGAPAPMVVRRYNAGRSDGTAGTLVWESEVGDGVFRARDIAVGVARVYVVGETVRPETGLPRWTVYALDPEDGGVVWNDTPFRGRRAASTAAAIVVRHPDVFVAGSVSRARRRSVLRAYDWVAGDLSWQRRGTVGRAGGFEKLTLPSPDGLVAVGSGRQRGDRVDRAVVQVFDLDDGTLLDTRFGPAGDGGAIFDTLGMGAPGLVVAGGRISGPGPTSRGLLHTYRLWTP